MHYSDVAKALQRVGNVCNNDVRRALRRHGAVVVTVKRRLKLRACRVMQHAT